MDLLASQGNFISEEVVYGEGLAPHILLLLLSRFFAAATAIF